MENEKDWGTYSSYVMLLFEPLSNKIQNVIFFDKVFDEFPLVPIWVIAPRFCRLAPQPLINTSRNLSVHLSEKIFSDTKLSLLQVIIITFFSSLKKHTKQITDRGVKGVNQLFFPTPPLRNKIRSSFIFFSRVNSNLFLGALTFNVLQILMVVFSP